VLDRSVLRRPLEESVAAAVKGGVDWIQLRERSLDGAALLALADRVSVAARDAARRAGRRVQILVNRRIDVALACAADGVHLGFDAVDPASARALLGPGAGIGVSAHAPDEVARAAAGGASYAQLAPIFDPLSKAPSRPALGLEALRSAAAAGLPVLAQGGIDAANARQARALGAAGVAVTGAILQADDPGIAAAGLRRALDG
jgi:thiamine-phosphate pyrophosphorylase